MRIFAFPHDGHPYTRLFYESVRTLGVDVLPGDFSSRTLLPGLKRGDWLHFHWPSFFYFDQAHTTFVNYGALVKFVTVLTLAKQLGARIAWTAHNLYPHDGEKTRLHRTARLAICRLADVILAHGPTASGIVQSEFAVPPHKMVSGLHGHFIGYYPDHVTTAQAREQLEISEECYVFSFVGLLKPYKGLEALLSAFSRLQGKDLRLLVAGQFQSSAYRSLILAQAEADKRVILKEGYIADCDIQVMLRASDTMVFPYRAVLTSGAAILAMSFGRPVIAPRIGALIDHVPDTCGRLYDSKDRESLEATMQSMTLQRFDPDCVRDHAASFTWHDLSARFLAKLDQY